MMCCSYIIGEGAVSSVRKRVGKAMGGASCSSLILLNGKSMDFRIPIQGKNIEDSRGSAEGCPCCFALSKTLDPLDQGVMIDIVGYIPAHLVGDRPILAHDRQDRFLKPGNPAFLKGFFQSCRGR